MTYLNNQIDGVLDNHNGNLSSGGVENVIEMILMPVSQERWSLIVVTLESKLCDGSLALGLLKT